MGIFSEKVIPSSSGRSCTGVTCVIENWKPLEGENLLAIFTFKKRETLLNDIQNDLKNLWTTICILIPDLAQPALTRLTKEDAASAYEGLRSELQKENEKVEEALRALRADDDTSRLFYRRRKDQIAQCLDNVNSSRVTYAENWDTWYPLLQDAFSDHEEQKRCLLEDYALRPAEPLPDGTPRYQTADENRVEFFVTKHRARRAEKAGIGSVDCYYYVAIQNALIQTRFPGISERIRLIDTVGIGDASSDTKTRMKTAISQESDAVIFLHKYSDRYEADNYAHMRDIDELANAYWSYERLLAKYWIAFLVNVEPKKERAGVRIRESLDDLRNGL